MNKPHQNQVIEAYHDNALQFCDTAVALLLTKEGQCFCFDKPLIIVRSSTGEILQGNQLLEIGCGFGHISPHQNTSFDAANYIGIDTVSKLIEYMQRSYQNAKSDCKDIFQSLLPQEFNYGFISGVFIPYWRKNIKDFTLAIFSNTFAACRISFVFNFICSQVNFANKAFNYFAPNYVLSKILANLSEMVLMHHQYQDRDVVVVVGR